MRYRFLRYPGGKAKAVTLSYDDGVEQDIRLIETELDLSRRLRCYIEGRDDTGKDLHAVHFDIPLHHVP